ncbi:LysR family transcriptional regulator [Streptomyces sp. LP11]|uniref:LysR family transcriptional regulator n=1 Tax=Streptomyces pyxinicus TaxID=2970331 RepID=A0ABT2AUB2_9ACTN|nr:LysR family transcriptional regulator [Streptomyces sp. LP11]MCS0599750.1 LysR family transcriptional regulator [Streptomyces sp. LP11]
MELEARHLRCLETVATAGSLNKAARLMGLSQPALSAQLRRIEALVGGPIFERGAFGARPTPLGEVLLPYAAEVLRGLDELARAIKRHRATAGGRPLRLGARTTPLALMTYDVATGIFPGDVAELTVLDRSAEAIAALVRGDVDLVLHTDFPGRPIVPPAGVRMTVLGSEPLFIGLPEGHPLAIHTEIDLADLAGTTWLMAVNGDDEFDRHLIEQCRLAGHRTMVVRAVEPLLLVQLMRRGGPVVLAMNALSSGLTIPAVVRELRGSPVRTRHVLLWRQDGGPAGGGFAERMRAGLLDAYRAALPHSGRIPGWWERNPGWLGSATGA